MAVQQTAQWQLHGRKAQKVAARQQTQITRLQTELLRQHRRQRGGDGAHQRRAKVSSGKGQEHPDGGPGLKPFVRGGQRLGVSERHVVLALQTPSRFIR